MSENNIAVILNELEHIKKEIADIKESLKDKCNDCKHTPGMKDQIKLIWLAIGASVAAGYNHVIGK